MASVAPTVLKPRGSAAEVLAAAFALGLRSFGGPVAHLGYFEATYVRARGWLTSEEFASTVALCQSLPGPTSSQVGFLIGWQRAGWMGAMAAWIGFTLPSAVLMFGLGLIGPGRPAPRFDGFVHGLELAAATVVTMAVVQMARQLCSTPARRAIAIGAAMWLVFAGGTGTQVLVLVLAALAGLVVCRADRSVAPPPRADVSRGTAARALLVFAVLFVTLPFVAATHPSSLAAFANVFYRAGSLVFGGGHVVLPLLREPLHAHGWLDDRVILTGYGAAQALPGPLFSFAAYAGAASVPLRAAWLWALVGLVSIFLPGLLLATGAVSLWTAMARRPAAAAAIAGVNAAVVGLLAAALYDPIGRAAIVSLWDVARLAVALAILWRWPRRPLATVAFCIAAEALSPF
jgi:chromate transporter